MGINKKELLWRIIDLETVSASYEDILDAFDDRLKKLEKLAKENKKTKKTVKKGK